jgi:pyruvate dehydrogenase E2 component (dihydrolipoamide acetyltransferase)
VRVGQPIMVTVDDKSLVGAFSSFSASTTAPATVVSTPAPKQAPVPVPAPAPAPAPAPMKTIPSAPSPMASSGGRVFASPLARKLAREAGIDISLFQGSGPNGRIVAADVTSGAVAAKAKSQSAPAPSIVSGHVQGALPSVGVYRDFQGVLIHILTHLNTPNNSFVYLLSI